MTESPINFEAIAKMRDEFRSAHNATRNRERKLIEHHLQSCGSFIDYIKDLNEALQSNDDYASYSIKMNVEKTKRSFKDLVSVDSFENFDIVLTLENEGSPTEHELLCSPSRHFCAEHPYISIGLSASPTNAMYLTEYCKNDISEWVKESIADDLERAPAPFVHRVV